MKTVRLEWVNDDWVRVYLDEKIFHEGHSIPDHRWLELCAELGARTEETSVEEAV